MHQRNVSQILNDFQKIVTGKYFCFKGRSSQADFWLYLLIYASGGTILRIVPWIGVWLSNLWFILLLLPTLGIAARRLHDRNLPDWLLILLLIPVIGPIALLLLLLPPGQPGSNRHGPVPPAMPPPLHNARTVHLVQLTAFALAAVAAVRPYYPRHGSVRPDQPPLLIVTEAPEDAAPQPSPKKQSPSPWAIYRGLSLDSGDIVCYHRNGKFYADSARRNCLVKQSGVQVIQNGKVVYYVSGGQLYQNNSAARKNCLLSLVELKTRKGKIVKARIYPGYVKARDIEEKRAKGGVTIVTGYNLTADGSALVRPAPVYTVSDGKIYRGDSTRDQDCILSYHSDLNAGRLLILIRTFAEEKQPIEALN